MTQHRWRNWTEYALILGSGAGTAASVVTQQLLYASAPLTVLAALGMLGRRRLETQINRATETQLADNQGVVESINVLQERMAAMPTPESLTQFQRSVMAHTDRAILRFSREIDKSHQQLEHRIQSVEAPDLSQLYQDMGELQDQYTYLCTSLNNVTTHVQRLSSIPRMEAAEGAISDLKTDVMQMRVTLETLGAETRTNLSSIQNSVSHFERRLRRVQPQSDPLLIKDEVRELIRTVSELVPRREFTALGQRLQALSEQQITLQEALQNFRATATGQPVSRIFAPAPDSQTQAQKGGDASFVQPQIEQLTQQLTSLEQRLDQGEDPQQLQRLVQSTVTDYVSRLQDQLDHLTQVNQTLNQQQQGIQRELKTLAGAVPGATAQQSTAQAAEPQTATAQPHIPADSSHLQDQIAALNLRFDLTELQLDGLQHQLDQTDGSGSAETGSAQPLPLELAQGAFPQQPLERPTEQWIVDFQSTTAESRATSGSLRSLEHAIAQTQERLIVVWPWSATCQLDEWMVARFRQLLSQGCDLEIGWCHSGDRRDGCLLAPINQRWKVESQQKQNLKQALNQLLPFKQEFPEQFKFKILGTTENFLVCDRRFAILGVAPMQTDNSVFPQLGLKLHTTDQAVVQEFTQRFDTPTLDTQDIDAYFNRGMTRYDLGDIEGALLDLSQVLVLNPNDAVAHINRGVLYAQLGRTKAAFAALTRGIERHSDSFAAYCNRGYLFLEQGHTQVAIDDFVQAIQIRPHSPIPYFYRGSALQKQGDVTGAIADYSTAIELDQQQIALPYCYRSAAYQKLGNIDAAIADLEIATQYLASQKDPKNLALLQRTLDKLYRSHRAVA